MNQQLAMSVSPYHLTSREPPAMASLLLADTCFTLLPTPDGGRDAAELAAAEAPSYQGMIESWRWSVPLWESGVLAPAPEAPGDARAAAARIDSDDRLAPLRPLMNRSVFEDDSVYLRAVSSDVLRGGPDPALLIPLCAGLDTTSARSGLVTARSEAKSVAQRAELKLSRRVAACVVPVLLQADGDRLLEAREELATELAELRSALLTITDAARIAPEVPAEPAHKDRLLEAARLYTAAFDAVRLELTRCDDPDDARVLFAPISIQLMTMPADAALLSSASAASALGAAPRRRGQPAQTTAIAEQIGTLVAAVCKPMGRGTRG
ncbi:MAG: hypothetical protein AAGB51_02085 [Planctomycetota bacterium]